MLPFILSLSKDLISAYLGNDLQLGTSLNLFVLFVFFVDEMSLSKQQRRTNDRRADQHRPDRFTVIVVHLLA